MKELTITRFITGDDGTFGHLHGVDGHRIFTLELPWRDNKRNLSCIPAGEYYAVWSPSPRFGWGYELLMVENRSEIRIHAGNWAGDVKQGLQSDVEGCILLGLNIAKDGNDQMMLKDSGEAVRQFHKVMDKWICRIKIEDGYLLE